MTTLSKVISATVDDHSSANDRVLTNQLDKQVSLLTLGKSAGVSGDVSKVSDVTNIVLRSSVVLLERVEVRTSGSASIGVVTKLVDVESTQSVGVVSGNLPGDGGVVVLSLLLEGDQTLDVGVSTKYSDCVSNASLQCYWAHSYLPALTISAICDDSNNWSTAYL